VEPEVALPPADPVGWRHPPCSPVGIQARERKTKETHEITMYIYVTRHVL